MAFDDDELTYDSPQAAPAEDELTFDAPPAPAGVAAPRPEPQLKAAPSFWENAKAKLAGRLTAAQQSSSEHPFMNAVLMGLPTAAALLRPTQREQQNEQFRQEAEQQANQRGLASTSPELAQAAVERNFKTPGSVDQILFSSQALPTDASSMRETGIVSGPDSSLITRALAAASPELAEELQTPKTEADRNRSIPVPIGGALVPVSVYTLKSIYNPTANVVNTLVSPGGLATAGIGGELAAASKLRVVGSQGATLTQDLLAAEAAQPGMQLARGAQTAGELAFAKPMAEGTLDASKKFSENPELGTGLEFGISALMTTALAAGASGNIKKLAAGSDPALTASVAKQMGVSPWELQAAAKQSYAQWWSEKLATDEALRKSSVGGDLLKEELTAEQAAAQAAEAQKRAAYEASPAGQMERLLNQRDNAEAAARQSSAAGAALKEDLAQQAITSKEAMSKAFKPNPEAAVAAGDAALSQRAGETAAATKDFALKGASLDDLIGKPVDYSGYTGKLIRDNDGNFVVLREVTRKGEPWMIEVADSGKDPKASADTLGVKPRAPWRQADTSQGLPVEAPKGPPSTGRGNAQFNQALELLRQDTAEGKPTPVSQSAPAAEAIPASPELRETGKPVPAAPASDPLTFDTRHSELFHQGEPTPGSQLSLSELSALTPDQFSARYGDMSRPDFIPPQAESIRLGNEAVTPAQIAELKRLADTHTAAVKASRAEVLASGNPERIMQHFAQDLHADLFRKAYEHATGPEKGMSSEQVIADTGKPAQALRTDRLPEVSAPLKARGGAEPPKPPHAGPAELGEPNSGPPRPPEWTPSAPASSWNQLTAHVRRLYRENVRDTGKAFINAFSRATRMEGFKKTAQGQDLISRFSKAAVSEQRSVGELSEILTAAEKGLSRSDLRFIRSGEGAAAYQRGGVEAMPTPALKQYATAWAEVAHRAAQRTEGLGVEIADQRMDSGFRPFKEGNVKNYFPREGTKAFRDAMQRGKGEVYDAVVDMLKRKDIPLASLESLLDVDASGARRSGNIESPRLGEMEPTVTTKSGEVVKILNTNWQTAAEKYVQSVSRRLSIIENFGDHKEDGTWVSGQKAAENIVNGAVKSLDGLGHKAEARVAADMWSALNGTQNQAALKWLRAHKLETPIATGEAIARTAMLTGATPSQFATGWIPTASRFGTAETAKAITRLESTHLGLDPKTAFEQHLREQTGVLAADMLGSQWSTKDLLAFGRESGATAKDTLGHSYTTEDIAGSAQKASNTVLSAVGFNASNRFLNSVAVLASAENLANSVQILRDGKTGAARRVWGLDAESAAKGLRDNFDFSQADIDRMAQTGITKADLAQAMQRGTSKTNLFRETVFERPPWMNAVLARKMMAYTSYARAMGNTFADALSSAKTGNVRPIATLLIGGTVGGAALKEFKDLLFRKPSDPPDKDALDTAARLLNYQMNASIYGLAGSYAQTIGYGIKRGDFSGPGSAMLDWWLKNAAGAVKSAKAGSLTPSYEAFARSTPVVKAVDAWVGGPLASKKGGAEAEDIRSKAKDFKATLPGRGSDDPKFKDLVSALSGNDRVAARAAIAALRRSHGGSEGIRKALDTYADYTFTGSHETEAKFLRTLTPDQRVTYNALLKARRDIARKGQAMVR